MEQDLVTTIIPVYNVEDYLEQCIDSVINQTYKNIEIILIDDGSTDNSGIICDKYGQRDQRIRVIHKENGGLSSARNTGLDIMEGKYVYFLDSDDYLALDLIEVYVELIKKYNADIVQGTFYEFYGNVNKEPERNNPYVDKFTTEEALRSMLLDRKLVHAAAGSLYKSVLYNDIRFPLGLLYEDLATTYYVVAKSQKIIRCDDSRYFYRMRLGSIMNSRVTEKDMVLLDIVDRVTDDMKKMYPALGAECLRKQIVVYLKFYSRILYTGMNSYMEYQQRIEEMLQSKSKEFMKLECVRYIDKMKIRTFLFGKHAFLSVYVLNDMFQKLKKKLA